MRLLSVSWAAPVYAQSTNDKTKPDKAAANERGQTGGADKVSNQMSVKPTLSPKQQDHEMQITIS
jgi:hypothetical protein